MRIHIYNMLARGYNDNVPETTTSNDGLGWDPEIKKIIERRKRAIELGEPLEIRPMISGTQSADIINDLFNPRMDSLDTDLFGSQVDLLSAEKDAKKKDNVVIKCIQTMKLCLDTLEKHFAIDHTKL